MKASIIARPSKSNMKNTNAVLSINSNILLLELRWKKNFARSKANIFIWTKYMMSGKKLNNVLAKQVRNLKPTYTLSDSIF